MTLNQKKCLHAYNCRPHITAADIRAASEIIAGIVTVAMVIILLLGA